MRQRLVRLFSKWLVALQAPDPELDAALIKVALWDWSREVIDEYSSLLRRKGKKDHYVILQEDYPVYPKWDVITWDSDIDKGGRLYPKGTLIMSKFEDNFLKLDYIGNDGSASREEIWYGSLNKTN